MPQSNPFHRLKCEVKATSTKTYSARGILLQRCDVCQLPTDLCLCNAFPPSSSRIDFLILVHRDELFKPTNTGRFIAQLFPAHTSVYLWSRLEPDPQLLKHLKKPNRNFVILFPTDKTDRNTTLNELQNVVQNSFKQDGNNLTVIILEGSWRQCRRMFNLSPWLQGIPSIALQPTSSTQYATREATFEHSLSTAEAVSLLLKELELEKESVLLHQVFEQFNTRYRSIKVDTKNKGEHKSSPSQN